MSTPNPVTLPPLTESVESGGALLGSKDVELDSFATLRTERPYWQLLLLSAVLLLLFAPVIAGLFVNWYQDPDYSQGFFVPMLSAYLVWRKRGELLTLTARPSWHGLFIVIVSLGLLFLGSLGAELFLARIAFVGTVAGLIVYFLGWPALRSISFPMGFLLLMIPLPVLVYNEIVFPLQFLASSLATKILETLNLFPLMREGNILVLPHNRLEVVEACSGIRSLMALITLAVGYGYFAERNRHLRIMLVLLMIPLAVASNGFRVVGTALLTYYLGSKAADGFLHSFSGWVIFVVATGMLLLLHKAINSIRGKPARTAAQR